MFRSWQFVPTEASSLWSGSVRRMPQMKDCTGFAPHSSCRQERSCRSRPNQARRRCWSNSFHRDIEGRSIHHAEPLELYPDAMDAWPREDQVELNLWASVGQNRVAVNHVD